MVHGYRGREEGVAGKKMLAPTPPIEHRHSLASPLFPSPNPFPLTSSPLLLLLLFFLLRQSLSRYPRLM